jgi:hypothetical protein
VSEINVAQPALSHGSATLPRMGHLLGHARVSTTDQQPQLQIDALERAGCYRVFTETASGTRADRPTLEQVLDQLRPGDTLVVWKLDRLGRSLRHLVDTVTSLADRGIGFRSLQEAIDTTTPGGKLVFRVFAALAEFERDLTMRSPFFREAPAGRSWAAAYTGTSRWERSRNSAPARTASRTRHAPSAVRPLIQEAARRRWAGAAGGGRGFRLDGVDAPWGWSSVGRRCLIRAYPIKGVIRTR